MKNKHKIKIDFKIRKEVVTEKRKIKIMNIKMQIGIIMKKIKKRNRAHKEKTDKMREETETKEKVPTATNFK